MNCSLGNILSTERPTTHRNIDFSEKVEERNMFAIFCRIEPFLETFIINFFLTRDICSQCLSREKIIETLSVVDVGFSIEEDPVCVFEDLFAGVDDTWLDISWRMEDFPRKVSSGCDNDESFFKKMSIDHFLEDGETYL